MVLLMLCYQCSRWFCYYFAIILIFFRYYFFFYFAIYLLIFCYYFFYYFAYYFFYYFTLFCYYFCHYFVFISLLILLLFRYHVAIILLLFCYYFAAFFPKETSRQGRAGAQGRFQSFEPAKQPIEHKAQSGGANSGTKHNRSIQSRGSAATGPDGWSCKLVVTNRSRETSDKQKKRGGKERGYKKRKGGGKRRSAITACTSHAYVPTVHTGTTLDRSHIAIAVYRFATAQRLSAERGGGGEERK